MASNEPKLKSPNAKNKTQITFESLKEDLDCPVCYDVPESLPIYQCLQGHIICNSCYPKLNNCPVCRVNLNKVYKIRALIAEKILQKHRDVPYNQSISSDQGQRRRQAGQPGQSAGHEQPAEHGFDIFFCLFVTLFCVHFNKACSSSSANEDTYSQSRLDSTTTDLRIIKIQMGNNNGDGMDGGLLGKDTKEIS